MTKRLSSVKDWFRFASVVVTIAIFLTTVFVEVYSQYGVRPRRASAQGGDLALAQERKIELQAWPNAPVKIVGIKSAGKERKINSKFQEEDDDWLKGLTLKLKNVSHKNIVYIEAILQFPRREDTPTSQEPPLAIPFSYGDEQFQPGQATGETKNLVKVGDIIEIPLPDDVLTATRVELINQDYPSSIKYVRVRATTVIFDDGVIWRAGGFMRRDPNNPHRWEPIPRRPQGRVLPRSTTETLSFKRILFGMGNWNSRERETRVATSPVVQGSGCVAQGPTTNDPCFSDRDTCRVRSDSENGECPFCLPAVLLRPSRVACKSSSPGVTCTVTFSNISVAEPCPPRYVDGTCNGLADWTNYPSTGCITGLFFGCPCTRSNAFISRCADPTGYDQESCSCPDGQSNTPIVIDVDHNGFSMTDAPGGVVFDFLNDGVPLQISWTAAGSTNAFLVLDRNSNGTIDNGTELFGDLTPQPVSSEANGFLALAQYDTAGNGGNGNGRTDAQDATFSNLRLWQDVNHNGFSEASELHTLGALGITGIDLKYKESKKTDAFGNKFRYRAKVYDANGAHSGRWAWDVFLTVQ
jgi:hypothetical protein